LRKCGKLGAEVENTCDRGSVFHRQSAKNADLDLFAALVSFRQERHERAVLMIAESGMGAGIWADLSAEAARASGAKGLHALRIACYFFRLD